MELAELLAQTSLTKEIKQGYAARLLMYKDISDHDIKQAVKTEGRIYVDHRRAYYEDTYERKLNKKIDEETGETIYTRVPDPVLDSANEGLYIAYAYMVNYLMRMLAKK